MTNQPLWTEKYRPQDIDQVLGNRDLILQIQAWIESTDDNKKRAILISGPPGIGKTSLANCLLSNYGYQVREFNASDTRTRTMIGEALYRSVNMGRLFQDSDPIGIIMDEIDGIFGGGIVELIKYLDPKQTPAKHFPPIICTCNNPTDRKLNELKKYVDRYPFEPPSPDELQELMEIICQQEEIKLTQEAKKLILRFAGEDYRSLVNYLQNLYNTYYLATPSHQSSTNTPSKSPSTRPAITADQVCEFNQNLSSRQNVPEVIVGLKSLLEARSPPSTSRAMRAYYHHKTTFQTSIYENYPRIILTGKKNDRLTKLKLFSRVLDDISMADLLDKEIHRSVSWNLSKAYGLSSCYLPVLTLRQATNKMPDQFRYANSWSKFNLQRSTNKDIANLSNQIPNPFGETDVQVLSQIILHLVIENHPLKMKGIQMMKAYQLKISDLRSLVRIDRLTRHKELSAPIERRIKTAYYKRS